MLDTELVTLDCPAARCDITGFLPLHAVCANGLKDMCGAFFALSHPPFSCPFAPR